ncbi:hypothetical protein GCM10008922_25170 [Faecalicatena contorta]|uniref:Recombinase family protein n=1 Tax=Hungatella hathewayi TaxID=154046 RepID=A0A3E2WEU9_9FIRM|nr:recombinase family protein [Hungatella hathewayi]MEE0200797.1 recombinase family protein [Muricomes sp.]RGC24882.1 recombinase family protein [Hungatella hathewayi]DAZ71591.1 MAG TPA: integrase [Caudoviricetes sp.]
MKNKVLRVAIYIRVSTYDQARDGYSLDAQEKALIKWCNNRGYEIYHLYADRGISGKDINHRPEMRKLLRDAQDGKFDLVLFWSLSRFTRSVSDLYNTMSLLQQHNVRMTSLTESFDTASPMGRAMIGIVGVFAQLERELTGERVFFAMQERAQQGKRTCSDVLGYNVSGKDTFVINPTEAEYVKFVFEKYLERKNLSEVAKLCRQQGYRGKRGKIPTAYSVSVILTRPIYCGYNTFCGELFKGNHEPIIDTKTFNRVQFLLKKQGRFSGRTKQKMYKIIPAC